MSSCFGSGKWKQKVKSLFSILQRIWLSKMSTSADTDLFKSPSIMRVLSIFVNEGIKSLRNDGAANKKETESSV